MDIEPGMTLGRYRIDAPLGEGGMARVVRAHDPELDRTVALKVIRAGFAEDRELIERSRREARAVAKLVHPNIVQVFDFVEIDKRPILVMQYLDGDTLKDRLARLARQNERLPRAEALRIVREVAGALTYAHERGIVHRDIKPSNVMLSEGRAIVTDFGIARVLSSEQLTRTGVGMGTPEYMSPEQGRGTDIDTRSDIYSLGVMAYELLVGRVPFTADTPFAIVAMHMRDPVPPPSLFDRTVGPGTEQVLTTALAKRPEDRFPTATAFADALDAAARADGGVTARTIVSMGRARPAVTKKPALSTPLLAGAAAVLVVVVGAGVAAVSGAFRAEPGPTAPPSSVAVASAEPTPSGSPETSSPSPTPSAAVSLSPTPGAAAPGTGAASPPPAVAPTNAVTVIEPSLKPSPTPGASVSPASGPAGTVFRMRFCCYPPSSQVSVAVVPPSGPAPPAGTQTADLEGVVGAGCCQRYLAGTYSATASGGGVSETVRFTVTQ